MPFAVSFSGEQLTTAWVSVLELLSVVPQAEEADTVQLAFQSVQLLCSDYMSSLPVQHLRRCVEVAALYGSQQVGTSSEYPTVWGEPVEAGGLTQTL